MVVAKVEHNKAKGYLNSTIYSAFSIGTQTTDNSQ